MVYLAKNQSPGITIDALYAFTDCEISISPNACVIIDDKPKFVGVKDILKFSADLTKNLLKKDDKTTSAVLDGKIVDKNGQNVISYGEIVKTSTLRMLSKVFKIKKSLTLLRVSKKEY